MKFTTLDDGKNGARGADNASELKRQEDKIVAELNEVQGPAADIGGYYNPDEAKLAKIMRPSQTLNGIIDSI